MNNLIIDCFAGGGGASVGIEMALGRPNEEALISYVLIMSLAKMIVIKHLDAKDNNVPTNARTIPPERGGLKTQ